ncbi:MAG: glycosyltransferase [Clostridia bacterium]|nr:glycosyltransferase [Clostridia bacterium]
MKVQILLSTYNGEKYLRPQLDSFLSLRDVELSVLIRDDGSCDTTPEILREYRDKHGFEVIFGENIGINRSVYELARARDKECDFFAFADQDDIWLEDKLSRAVALMGDFDAPTLYAGTSYLTDDLLNIKGTTAKIRRPLGFYNAMVENMCIGHTLVLNASLMDIYARNFSDGIFVYDYWAYIIASAFGSIVYDATPETYYRQHGENAIGYKSGFFSRLKVRIGRVLSGKSHYNARQLRAFLDTFGDKIPEHYRHEAEDFFKSDRSFFSRLGYIFRTKAYRQGVGEGIIFRLMYLFGRYRLTDNN